MKHLTHLPNTEGFKFIGIDKEGKKHNCEVRKDLNWCHCVYRIEDNIPFFLSLSGWENIPTIIKKTK